MTAVLFSILYSEGPEAAGLVHGGAAERNEIGILKRMRIRKARLRHASAPPTSIRGALIPRRTVPRDADLAVSGSGFAVSELLENDPPLSTARTPSVRFVRFLTSALSNRVE